ncbi:helix-turn-helix transcriptional regulator [Microbacterium aurantiacum]|uniref:Helix-turn-helix transcriptional regulator n=1 Tax=Microbacterium aurantiacum TaxID=162393 RepID=A0ABT8FPC0_9MICO|nr:helix-turn-helix transcriptional regulator [Microbacterium aurantiacum]MDN4463015.1 helix-turn-helix transcriptional regulator [Microbacterium aurantiacum]
MASGSGRMPAVDEIARLSAMPTDLVTFWRSCTGIIAEAVPHYWTPCFFTLDPATLLVTSHFHEGLDEFPAEALAHEYYGDDVNKLVDVVRSSAGISTLHEATDGDPSGSPRYRFNMSMGGDQELISRLRTKRGDTWGAVSLYREPGAPLFTAADKAFLQAIGPHLAAGAQRAMAFGEAEDPDTSDAPGLLVIDDTWKVRSTTPSAQAWLERLSGAEASHELPAAVVAVAAQGLQNGRDGDAAAVAFSRVPVGDGTWALLHGAPLHGEDERRVAVIIEPAHPARIHPLLMAAYGLTEREQDVVRLVLTGASTAEISASLYISGLTVQNHLKSVFEKTGVRSRRDLVGKIFFTHYEPRVRDNEKRVLRGAAVRGGPIPPGDAAAARRL